MRLHTIRHAAHPSALPDAPTQLLVHGLGNGAWSWLDVMPGLARHGPVVAVDLPGSGYSRPAEARDAAVLERAGHLVELHEALGLGPVVLHGHSLGGVVAAIFAGRAPDRVERLVLVGTPLPGEPDPDVDTLAWRTIGRASLWLAPFVGPILLRAALRWKLAPWRDLLDGPASGPVPGAFTSMGGDPRRISRELRAVLLEEVGRFSIPWRASGAMVAAASVMAALTVDQDVARAAVDRISCPTLSIYGSEDRIVPDRLKDEIRDRYPAWRHERLETYGHLIPWEGPDRYVELVNDWLSSDPSASSSA